MRRKMKRRWSTRPSLSESQILAWADAFHERTGQWPREPHGRIANSLGEKWVNVNMCLRQGLRGLPGGSSLARLLAKERGVRNRMGLPPLTTARILCWADAHQLRTGRWPTSNTGPIQDVPGESWLAVDSGLQAGSRSLPGGSSLARLLASARGVRNKTNLPPLQPRHILAWADAHQRRTGRWPAKKTGPIREAPGETWSRVNDSLSKGGRSLPGGSSLARLLESARGVRNKANLPPLQPRHILAWADAHQRRTGRWPAKRTGPIREAPGETWSRVNNSLSKGGRSLPGGSSLADLLQSARGVRNLGNRPPLRPRQILAWADAHHRRTGQWPNANSGPIQDAPGETWNAVQMALFNGRRSLPGGFTLARLLQNERGVRNKGNLPAFHPRKILEWADAHRQRTGQWPTWNSGPIRAAPGETWRGVDDSLRKGRRGLKRGGSLSRLLKKQRGV